MSVLFNFYYAAPLEALLSWNGNDALYAHVENYRRNPSLRRWRCPELIMPPDRDEYDGPRLKPG